MEKRLIEVYIGTGSDNGTWDTDYVEIPADTPDEKIEQVAIDTSKALLQEQGTDYMFVGVYNIPPIEEAYELGYED